MEEKKIACVLWPDKRPSPAADKIGTRSGKLVYLHPVYRRGFAWHYLAICDCGKEAITRPNSRAKSCGCGRDRPRATGPVEPRRKSGWLPICTREGGYFSCAHHRGCQEERVFERRKRSRRFEDSNRDGSCYTPTPEELSFRGDY